MQASLANGEAKPMGKTSRPMMVAMARESRKENQCVGHGALG